MRIILVAFSLLSLTTSVFAGPPLDVNQTAYLKINKNRIFIYEYSGLPTNDDMIKYLNDHVPMHSDNRMTVVYIWPKGSRIPQSGFNTLRSIAKGNDFLYNSSLIDMWEFAYMHSINGSKTFVNCLNNSGHELCR